MQNQYENNQRRIIPTMATLKRPSQILSDAGSREQCAGKKSRYNFEADTYSQQAQHKEHECQERVKFVLFLKYLIRLLYLTDEERYKSAKQVRFMRNISNSYDVLTNAYLFL